MQFVLHVGPDGIAGPVLRLPPGRYVVGRGHDCQIRVPERAVSRRHCLLAVGPDRASVRDLGSRNRTVVNTRVIADEQPLRDGDWLAVCSARFRVRLLSDAAPVDPAWVTVPEAGPGVDLESAPAPPRDGPHRAAESMNPGDETVAAGAADLASGLYDLPLNISGYDLTLHLDLKHVLGRGEFGQVWWARTRGTGPDWHDGAVKISHHPDGSALGRLCRWGAMAAAQVPPHPGLLLPRMIASFGGRPLVETEPADNSLTDLAGVAPREEVGPRLLAALRDAAAGLDHLHAQGLVHGCPRPDDILMARGRAAVADWDLTHPAHVAEGAAAAARYGDPEYLAPEVWAGWASGPSDQYALACGYARLRSGRPVFPVWGRAEWERCHRAEAPDLSGLPARERAVVGRALAKDADSRYGSCRDFAGALAAASENGGASDTGRDSG